MLKPSDVLKVTEDTLYVNEREFIPFLNIREAIVGIREISSPEGSFQYLETTEDGEFFTLYRYNEVKGYYSDER